MNRAIFLDRDGTINVDKKYLYEKEEFEFLPGVLKGLKKLQEKGFLLIIVTNQSGIARGYYTEEDFEELTIYMLKELGKAGISITDVLYCPHLPNATILEYKKNCNCRKPKLGLFNKAIEKWNIDISKSYAVGDNERDCAICSIDGCKGYLISKNLEKDKDSLLEKGIRKVNNFLEAVCQIIKEENL